MFERIQIAPSILSADAMHMYDEIELIVEGNCDLIHIDVMDGHFVPNLTFGPPMVKSINASFDTPLDVHLMISNAELTFKDYLNAGADILTFHFEAVNHIHRVVQATKAFGAKAGVSINPGTPVSVLDPIIKELDLVLIMSVNPGFGGQSFINFSPQKISQLVELCKKYNVSPLIEVDGGINIETAPVVTNVGADVLVCGSAVFNSKDPKQAISDIRKAGQNVRRI